MLKFLNCLYTVILIKNIKTEACEPVLDVPKQLNPKIVRKILIKLKFSRHKIIPLKVKVTLTLRNDCSPGPRVIIVTRNRALEVENRIGTGNKMP